MRLLLPASCFGIEKKMKDNRGSAIAKRFGQADPMKIPELCNSLKIFNDFIVYFNKRHSDESRYKVTEKFSELGYLLL